MARRPSNRPAILIGGALGTLVIVLVLASLRRPEPPTFAPTPPQPREIGDRLVGPTLYTVDATSPEAWRFFDFSRGSVVEPSGPLDWDLAFRRFHIIANGGPGFAGAGGIRDLAAAAFDSLHAVPEEGYQPSTARPDSVNPAIADWYDYGFTSHLLMPKATVYAVRTADGRYAKLALISYYCTGARPGCLTFRYVYQGDGSIRLSPGAENGAEFRKR